MNDDELPFMRAILSAPDDLATCRVFADWLEERGDARAEFVRVWCELRSNLTGPEALSLFQRLRVLRPGMPTELRAVIGDFDVLADAEELSSVARIEQVAALLNRPRTFVAPDGYEQEIVGAALHPLGDLVAYVERRSRDIRADFVDIEYFLRAHPLGVWDPGFPIESYNPHFCCDVGFLEWYGSSALAIYRDKHTYVARFGFRQDPKFMAIEDDWSIEGPLLHFRGYDAEVHRLPVPVLLELPSLSAGTAARWGVRLRTAPTPEQLLTEQRRRMNRF